MSAASTQFSLPELQKMRTPQGQNYPLLSITPHWHNSQPQLWYNSNKCHFCSTCRQPSLKAVPETSSPHRKHSTAWILLEKHLQNNYHRPPEQRLHFLFSVKELKTNKQTLTHTSAWSSPLLPSHPPTGRIYNPFCPYKPNKHRIFSLRLFLGWSSRTGEQDLTTGGPQTCFMPPGLPLELRPLPSRPSEPPADPAPPSRPIVAHRAGSTERRAQRRAEPARPTPRPLPLPLQRQPPCWYSLPSSPRRAPRAEGGGNETSAVAPTSRGNGNKYLLPWIQDPTVLCLMLLPPRELQFLLTLTKIPQVARSTCPMPSAAMINWVVEEMVVRKAQTTCEVF